MNVVRLALWVMVFAAGASVGMHGLPGTGLRARYSPDPSGQGPPALDVVDPSPSSATLAAGPAVYWPSFTVEWTGALVIDRPGEYTFATISDDGSELDIAGRTVVHNGGVHGPQEARGRIELSRGVHPLALRYLQAGGGFALSMQYAGPNETLREIPGRLLLPDPMPYWRYRAQRFAPLAGGVLAVLAWAAGSRRAKRRTVAPTLRAQSSMLDRPAVAITIIVIVGGAARVLMLLGTNGILWPDSDVFLADAEAILRGEWAAHDPFRTMAYQYFLAAFLAWSREPIAGDWIVATQHLLGVLAAICAYLVGRRAFTPAVALVGALLFSVHPALLFHEASILTEALFVTALCAAMLPLSRFVVEPTVMRALGAGLATALLTMTRPVAEWYVLVLLPCIWFTGTGRRRLWAPVLAIVACVGLLQPWMTINAAQFGFHGVALGRGLGLFTRVFEIDRLPPVRWPADSDMQIAVDIAANASDLRSGVVRNTLYATRRYSASRIDREMSAYALDVIRVHPFQYAGNTVVQWARQIGGSFEGIRICPSPDGAYPCSGRTEGYSRPPFPNRPESSEQPFRNWIVWYFRYGVPPPGIVSVLAAFGAISILVRPPASRAAALLILSTLAYFTLIAAATQWPQDRYRLPVEPWLLMFAAAGVAEATRRFRGVADG